MLKDKELLDKIEETMKQMRIKNLWDKWCKADKIIYQDLIDKKNKELQK